MTMHKTLHPGDDMDRLYIPRKLQSAGDVTHRKRADDFGDFEGS